MRRGNTDPGTVGANTVDALSERFVRYRDHGDLAALGEVFDRTAPRLLGLAMHLCRDPGDAEDTLQQTFVVAMQKAGSFAESQRLEPWLAGILAGEARNRVRWRRRRTHAELGEYEPRAPGDAPAAAAARNEHVALLREHIDELPVEQRQALLLQLQHGLAPAEIAEVLAVAPGTVRMRIHRGLMRLRSLLPAGLAAWLFGSLATKGLANVRRAVLAAAHHHGAASAGAAAFGGFAAAKGLAFAGAAVLIACAWLLWPRAPATANPPRPAPQPPGAVASSEPPGTAHGADAASEATVLVRDASAATTGTLRVVVRASTPLAAARSLPLPGVALRAWPADAALAAADGSALLAITDAAGTALFPALPAGGYRVRPEAGFADAAAHVDVPAGAAVEHTLDLPVARMLRGCVVDADGAPVAGAEVLLDAASPSLLQSGASRHSAPALHVRVAARSAADGTFSCLCGQHETHVAARHPAHAPSPTQLTTALDWGLTQFTLALGREHGGLVGTVRDLRGLPLAGVLVAAHPLNAWTHRDRSGTWLGAPLPTFARSDAHGVFRMPALRPGALMLWTEGARQPTVRTSVTVVAGSDTEVDLQLADAVSVRGFVRRADGSPAAGVGVVTRTDPAVLAVYDTTVTRADGSYAVAAPCGTFTLAVHRIAAPAIERRCTAERPGDLRADFSLPATPSLAGRIVDEHRQPLVGWRVAADVPSSGSIPSIAVTDGAGRFALHDLAADVVRVRATWPAGDAERPLWSADAVATHDGELTIVVAVDALPWATVSGRLVDVNGAPLASVPVALEDPPGKAAARAETAADGAFRIDAVAPGPNTLLVPLPDAAARRVRSLDVAAGADVDAGTIALPALARLRVVFTAADGSPWSGMLPEFSVTAAGKHVPAAPRPAGTAAIECVLEPGPHRATIDEPDLIAEPLTFDLAPGEYCEVRWQLAVGRWRSLVFAGDGARPIDPRDALHVQVVDARGRVVHAADVRRSPHGDGHWTLEHTFAFGDYTVTAVTDSNRHYRGSFRVDDGFESPPLVAVPLQH